MLVFELRAEKSGTNSIGTLILSGFSFGSLDLYESASFLEEVEEMVFLSSRAFGWPVDFVKKIHVGCS